MHGGAGKTTFIKNLFASYAQDPDLHVNDASAPTCRDLFINQPERLCTEIIVKDPSNQTAFHYQVQDTPGGPSRNTTYTSIYIICFRERLTKTILPR